MKAICPNCGKTIELQYLFHDEYSTYGFFTSCSACDGTFDIDEREIMDRMFIDDIEKMADMRELTKEQFLETYNYITEDDYDATALYLDWLKRR